jgi:DNA-binding CsgD family transcriptional regulator
MEIDLDHRALGMTMKERQVAALVAAGHPDAAIAQRLLLSVPAVEWAIAKLSRTLGVDSRDDLVAALTALPRA